MYQVDCIFGEKSEEEKTIIKETVGKLVNFPAEEISEENVYDYIMNELNNKCKSHIIKKAEKQARENQTYFVNKEIETDAEKQRKIDKKAKAEAEAKEKAEAEVA